MPHATIHIKASNMDKWKAIPNKSEWVNSLLSGEMSNIEKLVRTVVEEEVREAISKLQEGY